MDRYDEMIVRRRMHGLYLSRRCDDLYQLSHELLGLHCWFSRNVVFSAVIRGAATHGWKTVLTKTWLYRGTLHGAVYEELPLLLALHAHDRPWAAWIGLPAEELKSVADEVMQLMADGVYSRAELRRIYAGRYEHEIVERLFSPWGGIFVYLARQGLVSFRSMTSRDFDLISAEPTISREQALEQLLERYFAVYGPATVEDATWFFGMEKDLVRKATRQIADRLDSFEHSGATYYHSGSDDMNDIPELTLLSGFDPYVVSYVDRSAALPAEHRSKVILQSGICLPSIAVNGKIVGIWNIKKNEPVVNFFSEQPQSIRDKAFARVADMCFRTSGQL